MRPRNQITVVRHSLITSIFGGALIQSSMLLNFDGMEQ